MGSAFLPPLQYLRECSDNSLRHFEVIKLEHVANLRSELRALWEQILEESAEALLARWMIDHRTALRSRMRAVDCPFAVLGEPPLPCPAVPVPAGDSLDAKSASLADLPPPVSARAPGPTICRETFIAAPEGRSIAAMTSPGKNSRRGSRAGRRPSPPPHPGAP